MTPKELQEYGPKNAVLINRESSRGIAEFRDEFGQIVELDGIVEEVSDCGNRARIKVLLHLGVTARGNPMLGVTSWFNAAALEPYEGVNIWAKGLVRRNLKRRSGVDEPSPFWEAF